VSALEDRLRSALRIALRERNAVAMGALRSALAALANATAVQSVPLAPGADVHVAGSVAGLGAAEVPRRELTEDEATAIVRAEIAERTAAAEQYGRSPAADRLRAEAALLDRFLD
jgi:uncharacterized protein YqeY